MATGMEKLLNANRVSLSKRFPGSVLANGGPDDPDEPGFDYARWMTENLTQDQQAQATILANDFLKQNPNSAATPINELIWGNFLNLPEIAQGKVQQLGPRTSIPNPMSLGPENIDPNVRQAAFYIIDQRRNAQRDRPAAIKKYYDAYPERSIESFEANLDPNLSEATQAERRREFIRNNPAPEDADLRPFGFVGRDYSAFSNPQRVLRTIADEGPVAYDRLMGGLLAGEDVGDYIPREFRGLTQPTETPRPTAPFVSSDTPAATAQTSTPGSSNVPEEVASPEEVNRVDTQVEDGLLATKPGGDAGREWRDTWKQIVLANPDSITQMTREGEEQPKLGLPSESITVAEAPRSFFDRIRGGISRIGDALSTEGVSEALGQFSQDIIATPDIGTALGPALSNAQAQLELGQERAALEEMGPMEIAMDALRRGDSQSAMQALNAYEILNPTPDMKIDLLSNDLVRHPVTGQTGYLAQQGGKRYFLPAELAEAANISEASVESGLAQSAREANRAMTLSNGDLEMAGVRYETDENGNPYQVEGEVAGVMSPEFFNAMLAEFTSKAKQGDPGFFGNIARRVTQALTREGMPFEGAASAINAYTEAYNFINPVVRFLSGAQMTDAEAKRYYTALMTVPGDTFEIAMNKRRKRDILDRAMNGDLDAQAEITGNSILFGERGERGGIFSPTEDPNGTAAQRAILEGLDSYIVRNGGNAGGVYGDQSLQSGQAVAEETKAGETLDIEIKR